MAPFDLVTLTSFMIIAGKSVNSHQSSEAQLFLKMFMLEANRLIFNVFRSIGELKFWVLWDADRIVRNSPLEDT